MTEASPDSPEPVTIYAVCSLCGALVASTTTHEQWHADHGEQVPDGE